MFWFFAYPSWILSDSSLRDVSLMLNISTSWRSFLIPCRNSRMVVKAKWPDLSTYKTSMHLLMMQMTSLMKRSAWFFHAHFANPNNDGAVSYHPQHALTWLVLWSHWIYFWSFWSRTSWEKTVKTTEDSARIAYGFFVVLPRITVSSSKNPDEVSISLGQIRTLSQKIVDSTCLFNCRILPTSLFSIFV